MSCLQRWGCLVCHRVRSNGVFATRPSQTPSAHQAATTLSPQTRSPSTSAGFAAYLLLKSASHTPAHPTTQADDWPEVMFRKQLEGLDENDPMQVPGGGGGLKPPRWGGMAFLACVTRTGPFGQGCGVSESVLPKRSLLQCCLQSALPAGRPNSRPPPHLPGQLNPSMQRIARPRRPPTGAACWSGRRGSSGSGRRRRATATGASGRRWRRAPPAVLPPTPLPHLPTRGRKAGQVMPAARGRRTASAAAAIQQPRRQRWRWVEGGQTRCHLLMRRGCRRAGPAVRPSRSRRGRWRSAVIRPPWSSILRRLGPAARRPRQPPPRPRPSR